MIQEKDLKKKKPKFTRTDAHKKVRLGQKWRKPKGLQNKRRLHKRGYLGVVKIGYKNSSQVRHLVKGLKQVMISNVSELEVIDKKTDGIIISGKVGDRKRLVILEQAAKLGLTVLNLDIEKKIKLINDSQSTKKKEKEAREAKKKEKKDKEKKEEKKTIEESVKEETDVTEKEIKDKDKKEFDKILTTKKA